MVDHFRVFGRVGFFLACDGRREVATAGEESAMDKSSKSIQVLGGLPSGIRFPAATGYEHKSMAVVLLTRHSNSSLPTLNAEVRNV